MSGSLVQFPLLVAVFEGISPTVHFNARSALVGGGVFASNPGEG